MTGLLEQVVHPKIFMLFHMFSHHVEIPSRWCLSLVVPTGVAWHLPRHRRCTGSWRHYQATGENHSEQLGHRWVGKEDCFNKLKLVKTSEISLICSTLRSKKSSPTTIPSAGAAQIGASEPSCSTEKFWRWVLPLVRFRLKNSWKSVDPAVHSEGPCACLTCPQLIQMQGSRSWIKDKTRRCDNWH